MADWQNNNPLQILANLVKTMNQKNSAYGTAKSAQETCVNKVSASTSTNQIQLQTTCNNELIMS